MDCRVVAVSQPGEFDRFAAFPEEVYRGNPHWAGEDRKHIVDAISGRTAEAAHCRIQPFWVESGSQIRARVTALVDHSFNAHWKQQAGHLLHFEALSDSPVETKILLDAACAWLSTQGARFARVGYLYGWQLPLTIDAYDQRPTLFHTYNPAYYHGFLKDSGFLTEKGAIEYRVRFNPDLAERYRRIIDACPAAIRPWSMDHLREETRRFTEIVNRCFATHWGAPQFLPEELGGLTLGMLDHLAPELLGFAEIDGEVAGGVYAAPDLNSDAVDHGVLLVIAVDEKHRGKGVNLGLAAHSFLGMIGRGYRSASYTEVLDDNWPSRRTAEKMGCRAERNFAIYRRDLA